MYLSELIENLQAIEESLAPGEDPEVKLATQPNWPFEYEVDEVVAHNPGDGTVVHISEGGGQEYLSGEVRELLGW